MPDPNADIIKGYRFSATLQFRTPLRVLQHHGEIRQWSENGLPTYAQFGWEGIWLPITKTFRELRDTNTKSSFANSPGDCAVDDGGTFLEFLKEFRGVVESAASPNEKRHAIEALSRKHSDYARYISFQRARSNDWPDEWLGYEKWLQIPGLRTRTARRLYDAGFQTLESLKKASDAELSAVKGVGKATILRIRSAPL